MTVDWPEEFKLIDAKWTEVGPSLEFIEWLKSRMGDSPTAYTRAVLDARPDIAKELKQKFGEI